MSDDKGHIDRRISHVESAQASTDARIMGLADQVASLATSVTSLDAHVRAAGRTNWSVVIAAVVLGIAITGGYSNSLTAPIEVAMEALNGRVTDNEEELNDVIETQIENLINHNTKGLAEAVARMQSDLDSRRNKRFNKQEWDMLGAPLVLRIDRIESALKKMSANRFTEDEGDKLREDFWKLRALVASLETLLKESRAEQIRRTNKVYDQ